MPAKKTMSRSQRLASPSLAVKGSTTRETNNSMTIRTSGLSRKKKRSNLTSSGSGSHASWYGQINVLRECNSKANRGLDKEEEDVWKRMKVVVRIRPLSEEEKEQGKKVCCSVIGNRTVAITRHATRGAVLRSQQEHRSEYSFDKAFDQISTQMDLYEECAKPFINDLLGGRNVTVFAYGSTGAGKTHTMMGSERVIQGLNTKCSEISGIVPQSISDIFCGIESRQLSAQRQETWKVSMSYLEVYNEQILDLLSPNPGKKNLKVCEDSTRGVVEVYGLTEKIVTSQNNVLSLLREGNYFRKTEATMANTFSSRSHAVLQLMVSVRYLDTNGLEVFQKAKLSLIDLAGSERASATNNRGALLRQAANINKSLLSLANCINALAGNARRGHDNKQNVKFRDSKLTHLLRPSLEGNCRVVMIANVNPAHSTYEDSHNTLKYANRAKEIRMTESKINTETKGAGWAVREVRLVEQNSELREENENLREELGRVEKQLSSPNKPNKRRRASEVGITMPTPLATPGANFSLTSPNSPDELYSRVCELEESQRALIAFSEGLEEQKNEALNLARVERAHAEELMTCLKAAREEIDFLKQQHTHSGPAVSRDGPRYSRKSARSPSIGDNNAPQVELFFDEDDENTCVSQQKGQNIGHPTRKQKSSTRRTSMIPRVPTRKPTIRKMHNSQCLSVTNLSSGNSS